MIIFGDFNARIGNEIVPGIKQRFNETVLNDNGELMITLCAFNEVRINNTFLTIKNSINSHLQTPGTINQQLITL